MKKIEKTILLSVTVLIVMGLTTMIAGFVDYFKEPLVSYDISAIPDYSNDKYIISVGFGQIFSIQVFMVKYGITPFSW